MTLALTLKEMMMSDSYYKILFDDKGGFHRDGIFLQPVMKEINIKDRDIDNNTEDNNLPCIRCWVSDGLVYYGRLDEIYNNFHVTGIDTLMTKLGNKKRDIGFLMSTKYGAKISQIIKEY